MHVEPIGHVKSPRSEPLDDNWGEVVSIISIDKQRFTTDVLQGLSEFSHLEVVYLFHLVGEEAEQTTARHPRGNPDWPKVGIFAQRAKARPNRLGVSTCEFLGIDGLDVTVKALDAIHGTPVLDIKPYMIEFAPRGEIRQPEWSHELMARYWRPVHD